MATVVRMPAALAGATEGAIQSWLAQVGQQVAVGEPLAEIETEKATVEYAAEVPGTVGRLLAEPGENVPVGTPIAVILADGESDADVAPALAAAGVPAAPAPAAPAEAPAAAADAPAATPPAPSAEGRQNVSAEAPAPAESRPSAEGDGREGRRFASPIVRRLAKERGIALDGIVGTGPGGRIVRRDLDAVAAAPAADATAAAAAPAPAASGAGYTDVRLTGMRRAIARRLTESKTTVPHFYVTAHTRADRLLALRAEANEVAPRKLSVNDFVLKAVALALRDVPDANAIWNDDSIRRFDGVDIAVAVAIEGGLVTPVVRGVHELTVPQISERVADLAERARAGRIQQPELEGGSFAVSNLGMYGVDEFSAILNPPHSGILAVAAAKQQPVVDDGQLGVGTVMTVTLSADHRVVDGAVAAQWMQRFVELIEHPVGLLL